MTRWLKLSSSLNIERMYASTQPHIHLTAHHLRPKISNVHIELRIPKNILEVGAGSGGFFFGVCCIFLKLVNLCFFAFFCFYLALRFRFCFS